MSDVVFDETNSKYLLDIDKTWHAIHYTLTGTQYEIEDDIQVNMLENPLQISQKTLILKHPINPFHKFHLIFF